MRIIKKILWALAALIVLLLIIALFVPKKYEIQRSVVINKPTTEVFNFVKYLKNQDLYSVWNQGDPHMHQESAGTDGTVGFINRWHGNKKVGTGEQTITGITPDKRIDTRIQFKEPFESTMTGFWITEPTGTSGTAVTWGVQGSSPYPLNIFNPLMDGMLGKDLQQNLNNLKALLEKR
jgi:hypothetical protein